PPPVGLIQLSPEPPELPEPPPPLPLPEPPPLPLPLPPSPSPPEATGVQPCVPVSLLDGSSTSPCDSRRASVLTSTSTIAPATCVLPSLSVQSRSSRT